MTDQDPALAPEFTERELWRTLMVLRDMGRGRTYKITEIRGRPLYAGMTRQMGVGLSYWVGPNGYLETLLQSLTLAELNAMLTAAEIWPPVTD